MFVYVFLVIMFVVLRVSCSRQGDWGKYLVIMDFMIINYQFLQIVNNFKYFCIGDKINEVDVKFVYVGFSFYRCIKGFML